MSQTPPNPNAPKHVPEPDTNLGALFYGGGNDDQVIQGHKYDGIREYDNPMPGWWVWLFVLCVLFAPAYVLGMYVFDWIPTYEENLAASQADLTDTRMAYAEANPGFQTDARALDGYLGDATLIAAGQGLFMANCAACHGQQGEGLIGPNLTDTYAIHGGEPDAIFRVITEGVIEKGMTPRGALLPDEERAGVMAYVKSIEGTNVPGGKAPEGDPVN